MFSVGLLSSLSWICTTAAALPTPIPVMPDSAPKLRIEQADHSWLMRFSSEIGRRYQIQVSDDLRHWTTLENYHVGGFGAEFRGSLNDAGQLFFRVMVSPGAHEARRMVWIAPGTFLMGSPGAEKGRDIDEAPLTSVAITHGFWIGRYEVTRAEYRALMGSDPSNYTGEANLPVQSVTWQEAMAYTAKLTREERAAGRLPEGYVYRLPSEAEFEYVLRAGSQTRFCFGDDLQETELGEYAWYADNSGGHPHPVGEKEPNVWGVYDMHGNMWEWCLDWYAPYTGGAVTDRYVRAASGPAHRQGRAIRGGGWDYYHYSCRAAFRNHAAPGDFRRPYVGFRVVLAPPFNPGTGALLSPRSQN